MDPRLSSPRQTPLPLGDQQYNLSVFLTKVYGWMAAALLLTAATALMVASSPAAIEAVFSNRLVFYALIFGELGLVMFISARIHALQASTAIFLFMVYAVLNGVTMAAIFMLYTSTSIAATFAVTAGTFGAMSIYGYVTKTDLSRFGNLLLMALVGLVIASLVNMFLHNSLLQTVISGVGVLLFTALTAYDTQKIKAQALEMGSEGEAGAKVALMGALTLYLDFINLFLFLLRFFGNRR
ncbi:Bax inhibitor-1/YccA family protein [uncultured Hymenobacter sp.]|uniref:Bax inhibitor-1/YccA family protein n=1 Tax=uncultured Hymenobacter sp. TaxID=170016 RepID=UPI0035CAF344